MTITFIYLLLSVITPLIAIFGMNAYLERKDKALKNLVNSIQTEDRYVKVDFFSSDSVTLEIDLYDPDFPELSNLLIRKDKFLRGKIVKPLTNEEDLRLNKLLIDIARKQSERTQVKNQK